MRELAREDEIGALSHSFEHMRVSIAENQAQILRLAYWDSLTGLPNRARFREAVGSAIRDAADARLADGIDGSVAVLMLDLNRFKHVNDVLGYGVGDQVLVRHRRAPRRAALARDGDVVARLSGDEFGDPAAPTPTRTQAQRGRAAHRAGARAAAGAGRAQGRHGRGHRHRLLAAARRRRRRAAGARRDGDVRGQAAQQRAGHLRSGDRRHQRADADADLASCARPSTATSCACTCSPSWRWRTARVVGAEALVRWQHPQRGLVPPVQFIPFAEQTGFIRHLTMWVFEEAARHWQALADEGLQLRLSVNLSTRDLLDLDLPHKFAALLARHGVPAAAFCLEITESAIMDDPQRALATLDALSAMGFKLSIDDFGTGYSSLAYLKRLPVDELKIDQSFVRNMQSDRDDAMIVRSTIDLAHNLGITVVAEGVETAEAWNLLRDLKCDQAQGYPHGPPDAGERVLGLVDQLGHAPRRGRHRRASTCCT